MTPQSDSDTKNNSPSLVPKGVTIGLAVFSFILSIAGYIFRLIAGDDVMAVLSHAVILVPIFVVGFPLLFWLGALVLNKLKKSNIQRRNALTLGWLLSCVTMLWLMGSYS